MVMWAKELDTSRETGVIIVTSRKCPEHRIQPYIFRRIGEERGGRRERGWTYLARIKATANVDVIYDRLEISHVYIYTFLLAYIIYVITDDFIN